MNRQQHHIQDFNRLCTMFNAGGGEFHFLNRLVLSQFNLKFKRIKPNSRVSYISACFNHPHPENPLSNIMVYWKIGRYDFVNKTLEVRTELNLNGPKVKVIFEAIEYVLNCINTGVGFPDYFNVYHSAHCCRCGKELYTKQSLVDGIGAECMEQFLQEQPQTEFSLFT
jgi:hypothetical protein